MILVDAVHINNGGGKILLDYLIEEIEKEKLKVHYLLDDRIKDSVPFISEFSKVTFIKGNFFKRHSFYVENRNGFSKVFCFGNLPPTVKLKAQVYTYFHQHIYLNIPKEFSFLEQVKFRLKRLIIKNISKNTNYWLVQTNAIKKELLLKFSLNENYIKVLPFYPHFDSLKLFQGKKSNTYLYVSNANPHKNHKKLINVFCDFYNTYKTGGLILTVGKCFPEVLELIDSKQKLGYPIKNIGFVGRDELAREYKKSEFLIFPSLTESFGLGLIEAIECGCKVIGADLAYTYEVCEPSIVFNPLDDKSFFEAFEKSLNTDIKMSIPKIKNNINELINIFKENSCN